MNSWAFVNSEFLINHYYLCAQVITPWPSGSWLLFLLVSKALPKPDSRFLSRTSEAWSIYLFSLYPKVWDQLPSWYSFAWKKKFKIKIWCLEWIWEAILGKASIVRLQFLSLAHSVGIELKVYTAMHCSMTAVTDGQHGRRHTHPTA